MIYSIFHFVLILVEVLLFYNLLIVVHEVGHFAAARWRGLVIEKFGIWFGKPLWKKKINGVEYSLGTIPAGGFVALPQMAPMEAIEGKTEMESGLTRADLPPVSPLDKIIVALAGPVFSFGLGILFACAVWLVGRPVGERDATTVIGYVAEHSPAERGGLLAGDRIVRVDGWPVDRFTGMGNSAISWRIVRSEGTTIPIEVKRQDKTLDFQVTPEKEKKKFFQRQSLRQIEILPALTPTIATVFPGSPAEKAGLKTGDQILKVNGVPFYAPEAVTDYIETHPGALRMEIKRADKISSVAVTPVVPEGETQPRVGIAWDSTGKITLVYPRPFEQIYLSINVMFNTFSAIFSPKSDIKPQHLNGPIGIMHYMYLFFQSENGWRLVLWFGVIININLAVLNLLPIPILDGGHILLAVLEGLRGRPMNIRFLEIVQTACAMLVIGYILYVSFFDLQDFSLPHRAAPAPTMKFSKP